MIRKYIKKTSARKKFNYEEIKLVPKSSFMIRQYFLKIHCHDAKGKGFGRYRSYSDYKKFKRNPTEFEVYGREEFKLISNMFKKNMRQKKLEELEYEKKYIIKKNLYYDRKKCYEVDSVKLDCVENVLLKLLC